MFARSTSLPPLVETRFSPQRHSVHRPIDLKSRCLRICGLGLAFFSWRSVQAADICTPPTAFAQAQKLHTLHGSDYGTLGNWFQQRRQFSCAAATFRRGILIDPASAALYYSLGISLYANGQAKEAAVALNKSIALDPNQAAAHLALGVIDHEEGRRSEALGHWEKVLLIDPGMVTAIDWIAKARIEAGQYSAAAEMLKAAPDDEELVLDLIVADSKAGSFDEAISRGRQAVEAHPGWSSAVGALATVLVQRNRYEEAAAVLRKAQEYHSGDRALDLLYLRVLALKGDTDTAEPLGQELLKQHPSDFDLLYLNGLVEYQRGEYEMAVQHLQAAATINKKHYDVRYNLGSSLLKLHRPEEARSQLTQAIMLDPSAPEAHFQMAAALRALKQPEAAQQELLLYQQRMQTRAMHDRDIALSVEAEQKLDSGDTASAISLYREVTVDAPEDAQAFYNLAMALDHANDLKGERIALQEAVKLRVSFAAAMNQLGYVNSLEGNNAAAEAWFRRAISSSPQFAEAENNLGTLLASTERENEAEEHFRFALAANPRYTDAWINLSAMLASSSRFAEARGAVQNALRIDPHNADAARLLRSLPQEEAAKP
jgi:tetratricopeptide (TPR) repeat protein